MPRQTTTVRHGGRETSHPVLRAMGVVAAAVLGFGLVFVQTLTGSVSASIDSKDITSLVTSTPEAPTDFEDGEPVNILLMGSDVRDGANGEIGGEVAEGMRNDTTIIAHVSGDRSRVDLVSIPRDLQVPISDCRLFDGTPVKGWTGDFNIAFFNGGVNGDASEAAACVINTIHDVFDVRIDHYAVVDFTGFIEMVDALGGVPMCIPERIVSEKAHLELDAGPQVLTGEEALAFARLRTAEVGDVSGSDLQRIERQQTLLMQTMRTALAKNLLTDAPELTAFVRAGAESLTMDESLADVPSMVGLAYSLRGISADDLTFETIPWQYTEDRLNVEMTEDAQALLDDLRHDRPLSVEAEGDATSEWDDGLATATPEPVQSATSAPAATSSGDAAQQVLELCRDL